MAQIRTWIVESYEGQQSVGQFLRSTVKLSRHQIRSLKFRESGILKNGERCRVTDMIVPGDRISLQLDDERRNSGHLVDGNGEVCVLYEDEDLMVVDKPAGLVVHPTGGHFSDTLMNRVAAYLRTEGEPGRLSVIGRLDRETSGCVIITRHPVAAARMQRQRENGQLQKEYLAVVEGNLLPDGCIHTIDRPIGVDPERARCMKVGGVDAKPAVTHYEILQTQELQTAIRLRLETGRTHQIRVHMQSIGHPLIGDRFYGTVSGKQIMERAALHAAKVTFLQPLTGERIEVHAAVPEDMEPYFHFSRSRISD